MNNSQNVWVDGSLKDGEWFQKVGERNRERERVRERERDQE